MPLAGKLQYPVENLSKPLLSLHLIEPLRPGSISLGKHVAENEAVKIFEKVPYWTAVTGPIVSSSEMTTANTTVSAFNFTTNL